jgi:hypothetical protein
VQTQDPINRVCSPSFRIACKIVLFASGGIGTRSPLFVWVGVLLV